MADTSTCTNTATSRPKRLSCDRCHSQKVRCTRTEGHKTGDCDRCRRKGSRCVYSSCLPKGRPALYRAPETAPKSPEQTTAHHHKSDSKGTTSSNSTVSSPDMCSQTDSLDAHMEEVIHVSPEAADAEPDTHHGLEANTEMSMHDQDFSLMHYPQDEFEGFGAHWAQDEHSHSHSHSHNDMPLDLSDTASRLDPALLTWSLSNQVLGFRDQLVGMPDIGSTGSGSIAGFGPKQPQCLGERSDLMPSASSYSSSSVQAGQSSITKHTETLKLNMVRLSQLSASSSELLSFSKAFLVEVSDVLLPQENQDVATQAHQAIKAVFKSVNTWLGRGQGKPDAAAKLNPASAESHELLHYILSASDQLQDILRQIHLNSGARTTAYAGVGVDVEVDGEASSVTHSPAPQESSQDYSIICQLAVVCTTVLLNMYSVAFNALQRCLDIINASSQRQVHLEKHDERLEESSQTHLQLVSVIHVCSYSISRQGRALDTLLSRQKRAWRNLREQDARQSVSSDAIVGLKKEVEEQLTRLHQSLHAMA